MHFSKLEKQKVAILDQAFWDKFGDDRDPPLANTSYVRSIWTMRCGCITVRRVAVV